MKKQELIHIHSLVGEVANYCIEGGSVLELDDYHQLGTRPTSIHLRKSEHKEAVFALTDAINSAVTSEPMERDDPATATAD